MSGRQNGMDAMPPSGRGSMVEAWAFKDDLPLFLALIIFGPKKLPVARQVGKALNEFCLRRTSSRPSLNPRFHRKLEVESSAKFFLLRAAEGCDYSTRL